MPGGDRTGPLGAGPMTGRGAGYCSGSGGPGYASSGAGRGFGAGFGRGGGFGGRGRGRGRMFQAAGRMGAGGWFAPSPQPEFDTEKQALRNQAQALQAELDAVKKRLENLEADSSAR